MSACVPSEAPRSTLAASSPRHHRPHSPPSTGPGPHPVGDPATDPGGRRPRRFRVAGADVSASITVFLIAIPMSLGLAVAMGAPLGAALLSAGIGGIVAGSLGGSPLLVSGPSAGLTVVTASMIQQFGWRTTCAITIGAGLLQVALGAVRAARSALAVSPAIVHGTLAGIGVAIALAQLHVVLGGSPKSSATDNLLALPHQLAHAGYAAPLVGAVTLVVLILWPRLPGRAGRLLGRVPAALASVVVATAAAAVIAPGIRRVDLPSWDTHVLPELPRGPVLPLLTAVLTMTLVASLESLLSAVAVDKLAADRAAASPGAPRVRRADLDRELRAQGLANALAGLLGGLAVSGGAVRGSANVRAGATGRASTVMHGVWVLLAAGLLVSALEWIPLAALGALVMMVGIQMVSYAHIRNVHHHREFPVYVATVASVILLGVLQGVAIGGAVAVAVALHRLTRTRISVDPDGSRYRVVVRGQLTFLAVPRLTRVLHQVPQHTDCVVELDGSFMDHAAYEVLHEWQAAHRRHGGRAEFTGRAGGRIAGPAGEAHTCCRPWTPWRNHHCGETGPFPQVPVTPGKDGAVQQSTTRTTSGHRLASGLSSFQRNTAPLVREELARLAREGQRPSQLFLTCSDSRLVTSMITASGPGDLFTVRNVGNLVPLPGSEGGDDSVAAAIEYAVEVLRVESITVCGHSGCGAMQALLRDDGTPADPASPLRRWLRHGLPSLERTRNPRLRPAGIADRATADPVEELCLANVVQQLANLRAHPAVARRIAEGRLALHGMYFHVGEAQAYLLAGDGEGVPYTGAVDPARDGRHVSDGPSAEGAPRPGDGPLDPAPGGEDGTDQVFHRVAAADPVPSPV